MDRRQRPIDTRHRIVALALLVCLAGCGGHRSVQVSSNAPGTTPQGSGLSVSGGVHSSAVNALIVLGVLLGVYSAVEPEAVPATTPDPSRRVAEQDCTKPIDELAGNLRCR